MSNLNRMSLRILLSKSFPSCTVDEESPSRSGTYNRCVAQSTSQLGNTTATTCGTTATDTTGCTVNSASDVSYGAGFAAGGGGVYVCEFASDGIRIWFFAVCPIQSSSSSSLLYSHCRAIFPLMEILANGQRSDVPTPVTRDASSIDTSSLGTPDAEYLSSGCDIDTAFTGKCPFSLPSIRMHSCDEMEGS